MSPTYTKSISHAFNTFIQSPPSAWLVPDTFEGGKFITLPNPKLTSAKPLVHYGQTIWEENIPKARWGKKLLNASQFGFRVDHNTKLQCMRLEDYIILNFNNNMPTAAVFLDIEKAFDTTWHFGLLYKLSELEFSTNPIKLIASLLTNRKLKYW
jgi:hypothetical protein